MSIAHTIIEAHRTSDVLISENVDFAGLLLSDYVIKGLKNAGFQKPSPIQLKAIPLGRCGLDLVVQAKSGTGKTCVFAVVALESIIVNSPAIQVLVLAPTREIAVQVWDVICGIGSAMPSLQCHTFIGGMPLSDDKKNVKSCQIAIGTPGRIKQLIEEGFLKTTSIRLFILDEADKLLEEGFQEQINWIYSALPENKQMLALSATYPEYLAQHLTRYMRNPTFIRLNITDPALLGIKQYYKMVEFHSMAMQQFDYKTKAVVDLLSNITFQQCLVFSNLQTRAQNLSDELQSQGWPTACIAGFLDQKDRNEAMAKLKNYKCRVLISTDLSARGIDAEKVNLIINLDVPRDHETYLHRIGRAGRYGSFGAAVTIVSTGEEEKSLKSLELKCNTHIFPLPDPVPFDLVQIELPVSIGDIVSTEQIITRPDVSGQTDVCQEKQKPSDDTKPDVSGQTDVCQEIQKSSEDTKPNVSGQIDVCQERQKPSEDTKPNVSGQIDVCQERQKPSEDTKPDVSGQIDVCQEEQKPSEDTKPDVSDQTDVCQEKQKPSEDTKHQVEIQPECRISLDDDDALTSEHADDVLIHLPSHDSSSTQSIQNSSQYLCEKILTSQNSCSGDVLPDQTEMKNGSNSFVDLQDISLSSINIEMKTDDTKKENLFHSSQVVVAERRESVNGIDLLESGLPSDSNTNSNSLYGQNRDIVHTEIVTQDILDVHGSGSEVDIFAKSECVQESVLKDNRVATVHTNDVTNNVKENSKKEYKWKMKKSRSDNPNWRSAREETEDSSNRDKSTTDTNTRAGGKNVRTIPSSDFVLLLPSYAESIGYERVQQFHAYESARESLETFKQEDSSTEKLCLLDMIKTKIDYNVKSEDKGMAACISNYLANFHKEFKEKSLRKAVLNPGVSFSSDVKLIPVLKEQAETTENKVMSEPFPDVRPKSRKGNFMASLDSNPRQAAVQHPHQIHSGDIVQSLGDLKQSRKNYLEGSSESRNGYESDSSSRFSSLYENDVYKNSYAAEPELQQNKQKVATRKSSKLVLDNTPQESKQASEPAPDNRKVRGNHQTFWSLGPYTDPKHPFHDISSTAGKPAANDLEARNAYRTRANANRENEEGSRGAPESKKSNIHYPYGEGRLYEADADIHEAEDIIKLSEAEDTPRVHVHYPYGENPLTSSEEMSEHPEEELFYYKNVPPFGDPSVEWIQQEWQPDGAINPHQQWDPNTQYNPYVYQQVYPPQTVPFSNYPVPYYSQNYYPMYPPETCGYYYNYGPWSYPVYPQSPQTSDYLEQAHIKLIKKQKAYIKLMSKRRH